MGDIEIGKCEICKKENVQLLRTTIDFPFIECECHNRHFETIRHCVNCEPKVPKETTLVISTSTLRAINLLIHYHNRDYNVLKQQMSQYEDKFMSFDSHPKDFMTETTKRAASGCEAQYLDD